MLAREAHTPARVVEALFVEIVLRADDLVLAQAFQRATDRLAPFQGSEAQVVPDLATEAFGLAAAFELGDLPALRAGTRAYHKRRVAAAEAIVRQAAGARYRPDIV